MLKLFYAVGTCALASHIALEEAGAEYEAVRLDFAAGDQRKPEYLKVNPKGRVPALITDLGILTETPAILAYIAQVFPKANLAPLTDPFAFARVQAFNSYLCSTAHVNHAHMMRGTRWADEPVLDRGHEAQGAEERRRQLRADGERDGRGAVGDGEALHDQRSLSVHAGAVARARRRGHRPLPEDPRPQQAHGGAPGGEEGAGGVGPDVMRGDRLRLSALVCCVSLFGWGIGVHAQPDFPIRPVRMVNPYTPGGSVDLVGRALAAGLSEIWGQQVIVDNRPGAGTQIGTEVVVRAEPDGYTMLCTSSAIAILSSTYKACVSIRSET